MMNASGELDPRSDAEIVALGEAIAETAAILDAATHRFLSQLREFDRMRGWERTGARPARQGRAAVGTGRSTAVR